MNTQKAILVGLNEVSPLAYNGWDGKNGCAGCELDIDNIAQILDPLGYEITMLKTHQATQAHILDALSDAAQMLGADDTLVFYYAGHGGQQPDLNGDESDGHDETLVAYDGQIIDDQLNEIWSQFKSGVRLVMLSDSCNSGTNYRQVGVVAPEPTPIKPVDRETARQMVAQMIHMGGCRDGFTSAGYLAGGAFTMALVNAWNGGQFNGTYADFHRAIEERVTSGQAPQYNEYGPVSEAFRTGRVFRSVLGHEMQSGINKATPIAPIRSVSSPSGLSETNTRLLIEAYMKLLDTVGAPAAAGPIDTVQTPSSRVVGNNHLVCVHGISTHLRGYSNSWWKALKKHTSIFGAGTLDETRHEVLWSNLVNSRSGQDGEAMTALELRIQDVLEDRQRQQAAPAGAAIGSRGLPQTRGGGFALDDFLIYMTNASVRQQIINRFTEVLQPLLASGATVDILSHSWGTVVAYEGLRELEADTSLSGQVANFFTAGSALSIPPVRGALRSANQDGRRPKMVKRWVNLDAQGDLVGGSLGDKFEVDVEKLDLLPTECTKSLGGLGWYDLGCAHSSYFKESNEAVNRGIFGHYING